MDVISELKRRHEALAGITAKLGLDAAVIPGHVAIGQMAYGCFRYFSDHRPYYNMQAVVSRPGKVVSMLVGSPLHTEGLLKKGFEDIRINPDVLKLVVEVLSEQEVKRVGIIFDSMAYRWERVIRETFPGIELVDITSEIMELRQEHSPFELERIRTSARIADEGYKAVCEMAKPGVKMSDVHAAMDYAMKKAGAEETFTLMSKGKFDFYENHMPSIQTFKWPDDRIIESGDNIGMEITPKYLGYWTQLVRTVCVGEPNPALAKAHELQLRVIDYTAKTLKPGLKLGDMLKSIWKFAEDNGYTPKLPFGHLMGLDLDEGGRASLESDFIMKENTLVVLHPTMVLGNMDYSIFWGDSFLVTENGGERLNQSSTDLLVL